MFESKIKIKEGNDINKTCRNCFYCLAIEESIVPYSPRWHFNIHCVLIWITKKDLKTFAKTVNLDKFEPWHLKLGSIIYISKLNEKEPKLTCTCTQHKYYKNPDLKISTYCSNLVRILTDLNK